MPLPAQNNDAGPGRLATMPLFKPASTESMPPQPTPGRRRPEGATASGILNLSGNVSEWVMDHYGPYGEMNPTSTHRVLRGGSFPTNRQQLQTKSRRGAPPNIRSVDVGFRRAWDESIEDPGVVRGQLADHSTRAVWSEPRMNPLRARNAWQDSNGLVP